MSDTKTEYNMFAALWPSGELSYIRNDARTTEAALLKNNPGTNLQKLVKFYGIRIVPVLVKILETP